ncbi:MULTISPECIES: flagellar type III secretion system pore protein FliP [Rhizobium/Agrobacterium group]|jgi:flagellar biosynthetic protein FliP|uniref:Flagellar biosynthetic protein FliP n=6 Tax=Rhizobium/Agrobacterium group TaxID=227290 RepID=A0AAP4YL06_AGRTU|nr:MULTISPECIES: flagellar type III secretion system pore protein FliP [Rhizobium/Agrobacterium group]EGP58857.1 flagellar biosynthesis protein FliP [Agrobacterium tumefaciens F2]MCP2135753.1 flagellar biosynthetic protein FliP [Rhizobium sp. SLBN-94]MCW0980391.1 flagellar type III secretion system pore protein FliP [Agrobacterium sp. BT-220-3]TGE81914.1 flagellar biosynthetic protein FliP [Rhizobium sp. SEMIA 439]CUX42373.1 Flagellar transport protein FliP [Agrobacterium genomosp. 5 str. CFBP
MIRFLVTIAVLLALPGLANAQQFPSDLFNTQIDGSVAAWIIRTFGLLTVLSVAPGILIMVTSFPRFVIAFSILRSGMGLASTPSNMILLSMAMFMTFYVMSPTFDKAWTDGVQPLLQNQINEQQAVERIAEPFRTFMNANTRDKDLKLFVDIARERGQEVMTNNVVDYRVLVPAFMLSEIRRGFEIGFLIILPFLVIDLIVATITMAMGMMMLPPTSISLPFKILFFVLIDGWNLLVGSLVRSFN